MWNKVKNSRKFWAAVTSIVVVIVGTLDIGIDEATATKIVATLIAFIVGQGVADAGNGGSQ